jgi:hypothetical protein
MAVSDAFRPQASVWLMFLAGMEPSFVLRPVGKVLPSASQAQLDSSTPPDHRFASERGGAYAPPQHPSPKLWFSFGRLPIRKHVDCLCMLSQKLR